METYRITPDVSVYYVTYTIVDWLPVFVAEPPFRIVTESLRFCHEQKGLRVNAYVIMPTHLHAVVFHAEHDPDRLRVALDDFRRFTGRSLSDYACAHLPPAFGTSFRDEAGEDRARRFWQPTRHPVGICSEAFWRSKVDYLHANPCRKGLVLYPEDWRYSSARYYSGAKDAVADVPITQLAW
jgi:REP element-mobilizing transposase RayT